MSDSAGVISPTGVQTKVKLEGIENHHSGLEGVAYDPVQGKLFVSSEEARVIYRYSFDPEKGTAKLARKHLRLRWVVQLDVDPALSALEAMAVGIAEILVEGDAISVHLALPSFRMAPQLTLSPSCRPARRVIVSHDLIFGGGPRQPIRCKP